MISRLHSLCVLSDGIHWIKIAEDGNILAVSEYGFDTEDDALIDLQYR